MPRCAPPNASSGRLYMLTLNAATAKKLSEMPTARPCRRSGAAGIAAVASARHRRRRGRRESARSTAGTPRCIQAQREPAAREPAGAGQHGRDPRVPGGLRRASGGARRRGKAWSSSSRANRGSCSSAFASDEGPQATVAQQIAAPAAADGSEQRRARACDAQFQSGIHARPSTPVTMNAARHPLRTAIHVATRRREHHSETDRDLVQRRCPRPARRV